MKKFITATSFELQSHLLFQKKSWSILVIKRAQNEKDPWSGHYGFPGGMIEKGENAFDAVIRECREEVGFDLTKDQFLGCLDPFEISFLNDAVIYPHVFYCEEHPKLLLDYSEVESAYFWSLKNLLSPSSLTQKDFKTQIGVINRPALIYQNHVFWGISLNILNALLLNWSGLNAPWDHDRKEIAPFNLL